MGVTAIKGIVENGAVRLCENVSLPENTQVYVIVPEQTATPSFSPPRVRTPRLVHPEQAADFRKRIVELPADASL
jgi:hypothetical protein